MYILLGNRYTSLVPATLLKKDSEASIDRKWQAMSHTRSQRYLSTRGAEYDVSNISVYLELSLIPLRRKDLKMLY